MWSPETYVGYERAENFASAGGFVQEKANVYSAPERLELNKWGLRGDWTVDKQSAVLNKPNGRIVYRFHARDLHLVLGPANDGKPVRFRLLVDGKPPQASHGTDVEARGVGKIDSQRLYQLVRQTAPITDRLFEIEFLDSGAQAFAFTFG
jgi:hypothetical protein